MVGDQGVYLMSNVIYLDGDTPDSTSEIVYAKGCNPDTDEDWYENKGRLFGGDDGSVSFPIEWIEHAIKRGKKTFSLKLTAKSIRLN